jgi:hypothetical protein
MTVQPADRTVQATLRDGTDLPNLLDCFNCSSSSPARTALISASITPGSFSSDPTAMAALPFSNSIRFDPTLTVITYPPLASACHHFDVRMGFSTRTFSPPSLCQLFGFSHGFCLGIVGTGSDTAVFIRFEPHFLRLTYQTFSTAFLLRFNSA